MTLTFFNDCMWLSVCVYTFALILSQCLRIRLSSCHTLLSRLYCIGIGLIGLTCSQGCLVSPLVSDIGNSEENVRLLLHTGHLQLVPLSVQSFVELSTSDERTLREWHVPGLILLTTKNSCRCRYYRTLPLAGPVTDTTKSRCCYIPSPPPLLLLLYYYWLMSTKKYSESYADGLYYN